MTIPAKNIVQVNPGVLSGGGNPLSLNGVMMSTNTLLPTADVQSFTSADAVSDYFGAASDEYALAQTYFLGYDNSTQKPGTLLFAPYVDSDRAAWLQSGSFVGVTLEEIKAFSAGVLTVTVDGTGFTSSSIDLSGATSFTNAASLISAGFTGLGAPTCSWNSINSTFVLTSTTTGATSTITVCTGTLSADMMFTLATGAVLSQGADADTPGSAMDMVKSVTQNWISFITMFEPDTDDKTLFAVWANAQSSRYLYVCWDTDAQAIVNGSTTCFGYLAQAAEYDGLAIVYNTVELATFVIGSIASIDFSRTNARITTAFKSQSGFTVTATDEQIAANLLENGYSFYGSYATANDQFNFLYNGQMPGKWMWIDTFADQVYLNSQFQLALMELLTTVTSVPYNEEGYSLIRAAMMDPINEFINFGGIRVGIELSEQQKAIVNSAAGKVIDPILNHQGYYLQILDPGAQVRTNRGTPVINFWYTDGGAVQQITVASIDVM